MKISQIGYFFFMIISLFIYSHFQYVQAYSKPGYVGVDVNDEYIWKVNIDKEPFENYLEDSGIFTEGEIANITDMMFNGAWAEEVQGWRIMILEIKEEKEFNYDRAVCDGVIYLLNWYTTEAYDRKEWEEEVMNARGGIAGYDINFYAWRANSIMGLYYMIVANNIRWDKVVAELNDVFDEEYAGDNEEGSASTVKSLYEEVGLWVVINEDGEEYGDFKAISKYNDDGVLMYYEWSYDGEPIIILELEGQFFLENWEVLVIGAQLIGDVAVVIIFIKKIREN